MINSIDQHISAAGILLAIIGSRWTTITDAKGNRRLDNPDDHVRLELFTAFRNKIPILPIMFECDRSIALEELPTDIKELWTLQYIAVFNDSFEDSYRRIEKRIRDVLSEHFLKPQTLEEAFKFLLQIKSVIEANPLSDKEMRESLISCDPNPRINAYLELQIRPEEKWLRDIVDCIHLEHFQAAKYHETRPLWQLLEALHLYENKNKFRIVSKEQLVYIKFAVQQSLDFMCNDAAIDPGGECKKSAVALIDKINFELSSRVA